MSKHPGNTEVITVLGLLHATVSWDAGAWFVEGRGYDYTSCGDSKKEAIENFTKGLFLTLALRLGKYRDDVVSQMQEQGKSHA